MAQTNSHLPHVHNSAGHNRIALGVTQFKCMGAEAPFDHPHIFLDMGGDHEVVCPYCSTLYTHDRALEPSTTRPPNCLAQSGSND